MAQVREVVHAAAGELDDEAARAVGRHLLEGPVAEQKLAGILVFATWPTVWTLGGGAIIIAAGLYIWHRERQRGRAADQSS